MRRHLGSASNNLIFILFILALVGGILYAKSGRQPQSTSIASTPGAGTTLDAVSLFKECKKDVTRCFSKYAGQSLLISGTVIYKSNDPGSPAVVLHKSGDGSGVIAFFRNAGSAGFASITQSSRVVLRCHCAAMQPTPDNTYAIKVEGIPPYSMLWFDDCVKP